MGGADFAGRDLNVVRSAEIITRAERIRQRRRHSVRAPWLAIRAASSSRLVVPVFDIAR